MRHCFPGMILTSLVLAFIIISPFPLEGAVRQKIENISVEGLEDVSRDELLYLLNLSRGAILEPLEVREGIKRAFLKGKFEDIQVISEEYAEGPVADGIQPVSLKVTVVERDSVRNVTVTGNDMVSKRVITDSFPLKEGQVMRYDLIGRSVERLRGSLNERGFPDAQVHADIQKSGKRYQVDIALAIHEGTPVRIRKIIVHGPAEEVFSLMKVSDGDIYDQVKIREDISRIKEYYKKDGYFSPAVGPYTFAQGELDVNVIPGKKLTVLFEGNSAVSTRHLLNQQPFFDSEDFRDDLVAEAAERMKILYHGKGYPLIQIAPIVTREKEEITLHYYIYEGPRVKVEAVHFTGVTHPEEGLREILTLREGALFNPDILGNDRETLREYYNALGYLAVTVSDPEVKVDNEKANISFVVSEGRQTLLRTVSVTGNKAISEEEIRKAIALNEGIPYNEVQVSDARFRVVGIYQNIGFADVDVTVRREIQDNAASVAFEIREGSPSFFGKTIVAGNRKTRTVVVERDMLHREDEPFNFGLLTRGRQKLYKLGLFTNIEIEPIDSGETRKDVLVEVREGNAGAVEFGVGYADYEKYRGFFDISYRNLFGMNRQASFRTELSSLEQRLIFNYSDPWFFDNRSMLFRALLLFERRKEKNIDTDEILYHLERKAASAGFDRNITDHLKGQLYYEFSVVDTTDVQPDVILSKEDTGTLIISGIKPGIIYDTRDNPFDPKKGVLAGITGKWAGKYLLSQTDFVKMNYNGSIYKSLSERFVLAVSHRGGLALGYRDTSDLPIVERFFLGGRNTVRGYEQDTLGPKGSDGNPTGGNAFLLFNLELRASVGRDLGLVAFFDAGNVWQKIDQIDFTMKYTAGAGIRYNTPVGPLRVDYGRKLNRDPGESSGELHFSIGHAF